MTISDGQNTGYVIPVIFLVIFLTVTCCHAFLLDHLKKCINDCRNRPRQHTEETEQNESRLENQLRDPLNGHYDRPSPEFGTIAWFSNQMNPILNRFKGLRFARPNSPHSGFSSTFPSCPVKFCTIYSLLCNIIYVTLFM